MFPRIPALPAAPPLRLCRSYFLTLILPLFHLLAKQTLCLSKKDFTLLSQHLRGILADKKASFPQWWAWRVKSSLLTSSCGTICLRFSAPTLPNTLTHYGGSSVALTSFWFLKLSEISPSSCAATLRTRGHCGLSLTLTVFQAGYFHPLLAVHCLPCTISLPLTPRAVVLALIGLVFPS